MVHFAVFDPARKLKQLVQLIYGRSKRASRHQARQITGYSASSSQLKTVLDHALPSPVDQFTSAKGSLKSPGDNYAVAVCDETYYAGVEETRGDEGSYCTLKMENTLFKVQTSVLMRDGSVFADRKFIQGGSQSPKAMNASIIHLPENASRFRDLLWALHHLDLGNPRFVYDPSIHRLLNIAELSRKYRFLPIETWAVDQLHRICSSGPLPFSLSSLRDSSSSITLTSCVADDVQSVDTICSRLLNIAFSSRHRSLFLLMIKKLVVQTLWHDFHAGPSLVETIETLSRCRSRYQRHVHQLLGVVYYRMLVDMKFMIATDKSPVVLFPPDMDVERRMRFLTAHRSLTEMWDDLKHAPPEVSFSSDDAHISCQENWDRLWGSAARKVEVAPCDCKQRCRAGHRRHTADVLALLKLTMLTISQTIQDSQLICGECSLAGLESIDIIRDDIINSLGDLFVYSS